MAREATKPNSEEKVEETPAEKKMYYCPVEATMSKLSGKYKAIILYHLEHDGVLRFCELQRMIPRATAKMLTQQLRELEADGFVTRKASPAVPPKTEYSLTEFGKTLTPVVDAICDWGVKYMSDCILHFPKDYKPE